VCSSHEMSTCVPSSTGGTFIRKHQGEGVCASASSSAAAAAAAAKRLVPPELLIKRRERDDKGPDGADARV
jgi:hypothetical protein